MPELPEVETIRRDLQTLCGRRIKQINIINGVCVKHPTKELFISSLVGRTFAKINRRGKYLILQLDNKSRLIIHLRMTGRVVCTSSTEPLLPHTHLIITLDDSRELRFSDTRRFGCLWLVGENEADMTGISGLGLEPFDDGFGGGYLKENLARRRIPIKQALLDQHIIAGLGNIYADELLFTCGIMPDRQAAAVTDGEWETLAEESAKLLLAAIAHRGTTFSDYRDGMGKEGGNQFYLNVYSRRGKPCHSCGEPVAYTKIAGRGTSYCPKCQK